MNNYSNSGRKFSIILTVFSALTYCRPDLVHANPQAEAAVVNSGASVISSSRTALLPSNDEIDRYKNDPLPILKIRIAANKNSFARGEDCEIVFTITNQGTRDTVYVSRSPHMTSYQIYAEDEHGQKVPSIQPKSGIVEGDLTFGTLKPGNSFIFATSLRSQVQIDHAGRYKVTGNYIYRQDLSVSSKPIWINVR